MKKTILVTKLDQKLTHTEMPVKTDSVDFA